MFSLPADGFVELYIYDIRGRKIDTLVKEFRSGGNYSINYNASNLPSGIYFANLVSNGHSEIVKMILLK